MLEKTLTLLSKSAIIKLINLIIEDNQITQYLDDVVENTEFTEDEIINMLVDFASNKRLLYSFDYKSISYTYKFFNNILMKFDVLKPHNIKLLLYQEDINNLITDLICSSLLCEQYNFIKLLKGYGLLTEQIKESVISKLIENNHIIMVSKFVSCF